MARPEKSEKRDSSGGATAPQESAAPQALAAILRDYDDQEVAAALLALPMDRIEGIAVALKQLAAPVVTGLLMQVWMGMGAGLFPTEVIRPVTPAAAADPNGKKPSMWDSWGGKPRR